MRKGKPGKADLPGGGRLYPRGKTKAAADDKTQAAAFLGGGGDELRQLRGGEHLSLNAQGENEACGFFEDTVSLLLQAAGDFGLGGIIWQAIFLQLDDLGPAVGTQAFLVLGDALPHPILLHLADGDYLNFQHNIPSLWQVEYWAMPLSFTVPRSSQKWFMGLQAFHTVTQTVGSSGGAAALTLWRCPAASDPPLPCRW